MRTQSWLWGLILVGTVLTSHADERQLTSAPQNHNLDNNDNFSPDGAYLCYDTREMLGPGIENSQSIEKVEIATGSTTTLYTPAETVTGPNAAPGIGAVSYSFVEDVVAFIHGPPLADVPTRGPYAKPNRNGAYVRADGSKRWGWLDARDITDGETTPGAHRGGTHRHEYSRDGKRIGFTYDDFLLPQYDRTIGYLEPHANAPEDATHYFALLVPVVPKGTAKPGQLEKAYGDSWVTPDGSLRAFIGKVRNPDGQTYTESLFTVHIPSGTDITTADSGSATRFPTPPEGVTIRRVTSTLAGGIVRGSANGDRIAYYAKAPDGNIQIFVVDAVSDSAEPIQVTRHDQGVGPGLRWHPTGNYIACISNNAVVATSLTTGASRTLTPNDGNHRLNLVWSPDGKTIAYNKTVAHDSGKKTYDGSDFLQIFTVNFDAF